MIIIIMIMIIVDYVDEDIIIIIVRGGGGLLWIGLYLLSTRSWWWWSSSPFHNPGGVVLIESTSTNILLFIVGLFESTKSMRVACLVYIIIITFKANRRQKKKFLFTLHDFIQLYASQAYLTICFIIITQVNYSIMNRYIDVSLPIVLPISSILKRRGL